MMKYTNRRPMAWLAAMALSIGMSFSPITGGNWESKFIKIEKGGSLKYIADEKGNTIPDFSRVGYFHGDVVIPDIPVVTTIEPSGNAFQEIQQAIDQLAAKTPDANGFRGAILLKKGSYLFPRTLRITAGGIVLRGEGPTAEGTRLVATAANKEPLIEVAGTGNIKEVPGTRIPITDSYVPVGAHSFSVKDASSLKAGDPVILFYPPSQKLIHDLKMDQIEERDGTRQWKAEEYALSFERQITRIDGNTIYIDNPVVLAIDANYSGGEIFKYQFSGRIQQVGIENLYCESIFESDTAENHSWDAVSFNRIENGWVRKVAARYFAYSCVNLGGQAKNITVQDCLCFDHKSQITGGRRYSFNNTGQQNLFLDCHARDGRHDYVTGAKVCGPNVFYNCTAATTHADIGPHHRWAVGTLYDNIVSDGDLNVQDRGNWGSGHGWAGVTQVIWNCTVRKAAVQSPWGGGKNYCIGLKGKKDDGRLKGRPDGEWEGQNRSGLEPASLYLAQLKARQSH